MKSNYSIRQLFKKVALTLLLLFANLTIFAQTPPASENIPLDVQLSNVNQSLVTAGIIFERVAQIPSLHNVQYDYSVPILDSS